MQAALMLPGIAATQASAAEPGTLNLQVSRYEEEARELPGIDSGLRPLRADTLHLSGALLLRDSIRVAFGITQDTWSGATPIAVAPLTANSNRPILRNGPNGVVMAGASPIVNTRVPLDGALRPVGDPRSVLVLASASPELRQQADLSFEAPRRSHSRARRHSRWTPASRTNPTFARAMPAPAAVLPSTTN
jgi:hypothetical protein